MMKKSDTADAQASSPLFHKLLNSYALAAGSAGVSLLALAEPSAAEIIYTSAHKVIRDRSVYNLDLNHDGTIDLTIKNTYFRSCVTTFSCHIRETLAAKLAGTNQVVYNTYGAVAMKQGMRIGPGAPFRGDTERMVTYGSLSIPSGSWINVSNRYLGIKFKIKGQTHYGWARLNVFVQGLSITATLTGYAYETIPNKAVVAGKTHGGEAIEEDATLGELALGRK